MSVQGMGYFCVGTSKLDDWTSLAIGQLGLQAVDRCGPMRAFLSLLKNLSGSGIGLPMKIGA